MIWLHSCLREQKKIRRRQGKPVVFLDETRVNVGHTASRVWRDVTVKTTRDAYLTGLMTGLKEPTQTGPRFVILHAVSQCGFVKEAKLVFLAKKERRTSMTR